MIPPASLPFSLYQSERLATYSERLIHGFTGKPINLGGPALTPAERAGQREILCSHLGLNAEHLVVPDQTHSANIRLHSDTEFCQTDALIVNTPDRPAMILTADCVPIILYAPDRHMGAVIHAGWRGTAQRIAALCAQRLIEEFGAAPEQLIAAIGPAIGGCCYEVSPEVVEAVRDTLAEGLSAEAYHLNPHGRPHINLQQVNRAQLEAMGLQQIDHIPACTRCEDNTLWSYRRGEAGRQGAYLQLKALTQSLYP